MAEKVINGHNLRILVGDKPIAGAKECSIKISNDLEEISTKDTGRGKVYMINRYDTTLSTSAIAITGVTETGVGAKTSHDTLMQACIAGTKLTFDFADSVNTDVYYKYSGEMFVKDTDLGSPDYKAGTFSASFQVSGDLTATIMND